MGFAGLALLCTAPAAALNLNEAMASLEALKARGELGEMPNGYLGVVRDGGQAAEIAHLVNQARRAEYKKLAQQNGITESQVQTMAGQRNISRARSGYFVQQNGQWVRKP